MDMVERTVAEREITLSERKYREGD
jgi:hypothetical protein